MSLNYIHFQKFRGDSLKKFVVLFRGVNVGGKNLLPMKALVTLLKQHNYQDVSSYIQSGNIVLTCESDPTENLKMIVTDNFAFSPEILILEASEFSVVVANNPYKDFEGKFVHCYFCPSAIEINTEKLTKFIAQSEAYFVKDKVFYLHAPDGIGRSKVVANIESCLGQVATGRNLNTINKLSLLVNKA